MVRRLYRNITLTRLLQEMKIALILVSRDPTSNCPNKDKNFSHIC